MNGECDTKSRRKKYRRTALFWVITQRMVVISYRRFGTHYRSNSEGSRSGGSLKSRMRNACRAMRLELKERGHLGVLGVDRRKML